jgi:gliding motility-associated-like protein
MKLLRPKYCFLLFLSQILLFPAYGITAKFSYTQISKCAPTIVRFTNNSTHGTGITYIWDFGLGAIVTATDNSAKEQLYSEAGQYKVTLKVTDGVNWDSASTIITVYGGPAAKFSADKVSGCPPLPVNFTSTSTAGESDIIKTSWDFRNGNYAEGTSAKYTYNSAGTYDVILKVADKNGCYSVYEADKLISVTNKPVVNFVASDTFSCSPPLNVSFTNLTTGSSEMSYKWDFGNGKTSTDLSNSSVYSSTGSYNVKLKATDQFGCSDSLTKDSYIIVGYAKGSLFVYDAKNNLIISPYLCDGTYTFVCSTANLPDYTWIITDNNSTSTFKGKSRLEYKVSGSGKIDIKLIYGKNFECTDTVSASFSKSYIKAAFTLNDKVFCSVPSQVNLVNASLNADKVAWYISGKLISTDKVTSYTITRNDLPAETYEQLYNHELNKIMLPFKLVASNGGVCFDSVTNVATVAFPVARFVPDKVSGCIPLQVSFSDSSKAMSKIDAFTYKIGKDSVTAQNDSPVNFTITKPGVYDVTEIIKSGICYDTSEIVRIVAGDKLVPDFNVTPAEVCNNTTIHLTGDANNNSLVNMWRFKSDNLFDLNFSSKPDTVITIYSDTTGYKNISLQVDYNGCLSTITKNNILLIKGPAGNFSESFRCDSPLVYHFKSLLKPAPSLTWNIDTILVINADSVRYKFKKSGNYNIILTDADYSSGCVLTRTKVVKVRDVLSAFTMSDTILCAGDTLHLNSSSSNDYINTCYNEGFLWNFGDDSPPRRTFSPTYDHIYTSRSTDTVKLVVTADNGCADTTKKLVRVFRPSGSFITDKKSGCVPELDLKFTNTSTDSTIVYWIWNFGDQATDSTNRVNVSHTYLSNNKQTYYPSLAVYDAYKCSSNYSIPINITAANCDFQAKDKAICAGESVVFTPVDTALTNLYWDFGDGTVSSTTNSHTYASAGQFTVSLTASKEGCTGKVTKPDYISVEKADANFTVSDSVFFCYPDTVHFKHDNSIGSASEEFLWKFGSNVMTDRTSGDVKYAFTRPGYYTTTLTVRTLNGCSASRSRHIKINGPSAYVTVAPRNICYNDAVSFKLDSLSNVNTWKWLFGDGNTSTSNPVTHRYTSKGKIISSVQLTNSTCSAILVLDTIYVSKVTAKFNSSDSSLNICNGNRLSLVNKSTFSTSWAWYINSIRLSTDYNLNNILLGKTGDNTVKLIAEDETGCNDSLTKIFTVHPTPDFSISGDSVMCTGKTSVELKVSQDAGSGIKWTPPTGLSSTTSFSVTAQPTNSITYTAVVTNIYGCSASRKKAILVHPLFGLSRLPLNDTSIYLGDKIQLVVTTSVGNVTYSWSPNVNISCLSCNNPWVNPAQSITYIVEAGNGCIDEAVKFNIEVIADFYLEAPSAFTPNGDSNNDIFKFEERNIKDFELKIFNRWGEIVFSTDDVQKGWDGNVNGHPQNIDTYKYTVKAVTVHGYAFERKGEFLLIK